MKLTRFGKFVGLHLTSFRRITSDALFTAENNEPNWQLAHDVIAPAFTREAMPGYHTIMLGGGAGTAGPLGRRGRGRTAGGRHCIKGEIPG